MKKFNRLSRDTRPQEQPENSYPFAKNGIQDYIKGSVLNELGFRLSAANIPYKPIGCLETDKYPIILSSNNVNAAVGYFNTDTDTYVPILDDANLPFKIPFDTNHFITGQVQRNYKGELVGAFTDKNGFPFYVNFDNPQVTQLNDMKLFPAAIPPSVTVTPISGGTLLPGAYYAAVKYLKKDGTDVGYLSISAPKIITGTSGQVTDQGLQIDITNIDQDYDYVQVAIISKINGVLSAVQVANYTPAISTLTIVYSGAELTEAVTLEEILTPRKIYNKVQTIGQLNDSLYIMGLEEAPKLKLQKWANMVRLKWHSKLITVDPVYTPMTTGEEKSFLHKEVYAFFIRYKKNDGTYTDSFTIPGPALSSADLSASSVASSEGVTAQVFQVEDTISSFDPISKSGYFGKWQNASETYPDTDDYDSRFIGGERLRGKPVRHFRFPSVSWCKSNLYAGEPGYGRNMLDMLGISVENVIIPSEYASQIVGWEIFYAKRNIANSTVIGQSLLLFGGRNQNEIKYQPSSYYSTGGNWSSLIDYKRTGHNPIYLDQSIFRFHAFDMLFNKPSVTPDYISLELKESRVDLWGTVAVVEDQFVNSPNDGPIVFKMDYLENGTPPLVPSKKFKAVKDTSYIPNNILLGKWKNNYLEGCFGGRFSNPEDLLLQANINPPTDDKTQDVGMVYVQPNSRNHETRYGAIPYKEVTFLANLMSIKTNLFTPFVGQSFVRAANSNKVQSTDVYFTGDTYICDYSFHTYGWFLADNNGAYHNGTAWDFEGHKVVRRFVCECASNLYSRYEDPANTYSRYYPKSSLVRNDPQNYLTNFARSKDPNQFGYTKDSNALDDLIVSSVYNTYGEDLYQHPYRIHRGGKMSNQTKTRSWRTFLPLDYYEFQKNMGLPVHIEGMDDRLIIHMENAMFLTQDKTKLETDVIAVTLGSGDIFQFQPQEAMSAKLGYAGTQHELACVRTPFGYVFVDSKEGQVFLYKGQLESINRDMNTFFKDYLRLKENNSFIGNGYTIGYDPKYKRLLLTVKNVALSSGATVPDFNESMIGSLQTGDLVRKNGRVVKFLGVNTTTYQCPSIIPPTANNISITLPENTPVGTVVATATGTSVADFYLVGNTSPFSIDPASGKITLVSPLNYAIANAYAFTGQAVGLDGTTAAYTFNVAVTAVNQPPVLNNQEVTIPDNTANTSVVANMTATDREGNTLTYSIVSGNTGSAFTINSATGQVTVNDYTQLNAIAIPRYDLLINVSDGTNNTTATLTVIMTHVDAPPVVTNTVFTILDTTPTNTVIGTITPAYDLENESITYALISASVPGVFTVDLTTLQVTLVNNSFLNPATHNVYTLYMSATDGIYGHEPVNFTVTINVKWDRASLAFAPDTGSCIGGTPTCATGYTLSADGTMCTKVDQQPATNSGGTGIALQHYSLNEYSIWGTIIYPLGTYNSDGSITAKPNTVLINSTAPIYSYKPAGEASTINNLWTNTTNGTAMDGTTGRLNRTGVWQQGNQSYVGQLGFSRQFNVAAAGSYLIGVGADDAATISINGTAVVTQNLSAINTSFNTIYGANVAGSADLFRYWHVYEVHLNAGVNIISVTGNNTQLQGLIGVEVYNATAAQLAACSTEAALAPYIVFSSAAPTFGSIADGAISDVGTYNCNAYPGYTLVYDPTTNAYYCQKVNTATPTITAAAKHWAKVKITDIRLNTTITTLNNQSTPAQQFQDVNVPYYPDVPNHVDCGGTVQTYLNVQKSDVAQKIDCASGIGSIVTYTVPAGIYMVTTSQADADTAAANDVAANKQTYANTNGICNPTNS